MYWCALVHIVVSLPFSADELVRDVLGFDAQLDYRTSSGKPDNIRTTLSILKKYPAIPSQVERLVLHSSVISDNTEFGDILVPLVTQ
jgi:hypothetical protein